MKNCFFTQILRCSQNLIFDISAICLGYNFICVAILNADSNCSRYPKVTDFVQFFLKSGETICIPHGDNERVPFIRVINLAGGCQ